MLVLPLSQAQANGTQAESESQAVLHEVAGDGSADA
jgi:hypothetical protein